MNKQFYEEPTVSLIVLADHDVITQSQFDDYEDDIWG